ncbi:MAG TPA: PilZ domain-containing protein [Blastocatellia bacterium]|nr:PilZ domain-containing protein [Blastocatellia bacterium]
MERRRSKRFAVGWQVRIKGSDALGATFQESATLENLSSLGAYLQTRRKLMVGSRLEVSIRLPVTKESWIEYPAEVVRIDTISRDEETSRKKRTRIAMRFNTLKPRFKAH